MLAGASPENQANVNFVQAPVSFPRRVFVQGCDQPLGRRWNWRWVHDHVPVSNGVTVDLAVRAVILPEGRAIKAEPGEDSSLARIRQNFGCHESVRCRLRIAAQWARRHGCVSAQSEFVAKQAVRALP